MRRKDVGIWRPSPSEGFSFKSCFKSLLDPSPTRQCLRLFGSLRSLRKWDLLPGKCYLVVLILYGGWWGKELRLWDHFAVFFVGKRRKTLIICFGSAITLQLYGAYFYKILLLIMQDIMTFKQQLVNFSWIHPWKEKGCFFFIAEVCAILWDICGERNDRHRILEEENRILVMSGPWWDFMVLFGFQFWSSFVTVRLDTFWLIGPLSLSEGCL